jgi:hypothetical protein
MLMNQTRTKRGVQIAKRIMEQKLKNDKQIRCLSS